MKKFIKWLPCLVIIPVLTLLSDSSARASVNLPLHHWTYEGIERLNALGLIDGAMVVPKPYSRKQAARYVARAIKKVQADHIELDGREAVTESLLYRLTRFLRPELIDLGIIPGKADETPEWFRYGGRAQTEVDSFHIGKAPVRFRENRGGEYFADGTQGQTDVRGWIELTDILAVSVQPKFVTDADALGLDNSRNFYLRELNAKVTLFNIAFEIGRGSLWWGPGYHGSLLLTDHAFPLDMVKVGSDEPFRLPWVFASLGEWKINTFLTRLERNRDFSRANVFGFRLSSLPADWLELGFTRLTQFGGGSRNQSFPGAVFDAYRNSPNQGGDLDVNEQVMLDFRTRIPRVPYLVPFPGGMQFYGELGSEDKWSKIPIPSRAAVLGGVYIPQVFSGSTMDLRIEYADTDYTRRKTTDNIPQVWYNNATYRSGMRFKGFPLGHHMGTDGIDYFVRTTRALTENLQLGANFNLQERDRGQPVHETKQETAVDVTWRPLENVHLTLGYVYQRIKNPGQITGINPFTETFAAGVTSKNHHVWTNLAVDF